MFFLTWYHGFLAEKEIFWEKREEGVFSYLTILGEKRVYFLPKHLVTFDVPFSMVSWFLGRHKIEKCGTEREEK